MNPENRWVKKAETILWDAIEEKYAKSLRTALGSLLIRKQLGFSDRELVEEITENPYFQYFIGLPGFQTEAPFVPSLLVEFRKRLADDTLGEINEMIIAYNISDYPERILADKIYRNTYCREHGIRLSGPSLGRSKKDAGTDKKAKYKDNADRVAMERAFALAKHKYGLGLITSRLDETTRCSIDLSVIAMNVDRLCRSLFRLFYDIVFQGTNSMNSY